MSLSRLGLSTIFRSLGKLPVEFQKSHRQTILKSRGGRSSVLCNILVHHYFAVNTAEIWAVVQVNLPPLKRELEKILAQYPAGE